MMKNKRVTKVIASLFLMSTIFIGCTKEIEAVKASSADEAIELFNKYNKEGNIDEMSKLYADVYVDSTGYTLGTINKILKKNRKDVEVVDSSIVNVEDFNENIKKATVSITSKVKDEEQKTADYTYAIINEGNGWAISPDGIYKCQNFDIAEPKKDELNLNLSKLISIFDGGLIKVNVYNNTKNDYMFGSEGSKCEVIMETAEGKYVTTMEKPELVGKKLNSYFMARFSNLNGELNKVTITNVFDVDKDGNTIESSKRDIVIYNKA